LRSAIQLRAKDRTAALLALYTENDGKPLIDAIEPVRITDAPFWQQRQRLLHREQQAAHIGIEGLVEMSLGDLAEAAEFVVAGVDRQHVDMSRLNP
jgi:hypothetical protein